MNKTRILNPFLAFSLALAAASVFLPAQAAQSDWEEDERATFTVNPNQFTNNGNSNDAPPQPAPPIVKQTAGAKSGFLQGNATTFGAAQPTMAPRMLGAPGRVSGNARMDAETDQVLMRAQTNVAVPPEVFRGWLDRTHPTYRTSATANIADAVVEIKGQWDDASKTLRALGIRHESVKGKVLTSANLSGVKVIIVNCEGRMPKEAYQVLRNWVSRGGYLVSTDWSLHNLIENAFPGYIRWNRGTSDGSIVDARLVDADPVLLKGLNGLRASTWKLDQDSQMVGILRPDVRVLARSNNLAEQERKSRSRDGAISQNPMYTGVLACEFQFGRGHVLHLVGHYDNNAAIFRPNILPDPAPGVGISLRQAMTTNFIMTALEHDAPSKDVP
ncbi:MAG: hypothetical protein U0105_07950 [Candidatus Obscuribacterales bacterium]